MRGPIKNERTEKFAKALAAAIKSEDRAQYQRLMDENRNILNNMVTWELLAFKERVHFLAEH